MGLTIPDTSLPAAVHEIGDFDITVFGMAGCLATQVGGDICTAAVRWNFIGAVTALPEPTSSLLASTVLGGVGLLARRRRAGREARKPSL